MGGEVTRVEQRFDVKVAIKEELNKGLPFKNVPSRVVTATIVSYIGYKPVIIHTFQYLSH